MARHDEAPLTRVPSWVVVLLTVGALAQGWSRMGMDDTKAAPHDLQKPPSVAALRAVSFGDPLPFAKFLMLNLQSFDFRADNPRPFQQMDYEVLETWLSTILDLDPLGQYPLMSASRIYAEIPDENKRRRMLEFVYREFLKDPSRRWPWLAHAAAIAKHQLGDIALARRYASAIQQNATGKDVPTWARQMEAFILEDMNELETARVMIGGFLEKGLVKDASEARFLEQRLHSIEDRVRNHN